MYLYHLADTVMVGRLGVAALAAIAVAAIYTQIHETFIWTVSTGTQAIVTRRWTRDGEAHARAVLPAAIVAGVVVGLGAFAVSLLAPIVLPGIVAGQAAEAVAYVSVSRFGFLVGGVGSAARGYLAASRRTGVIMAALIGSNLVNVAVNAVLIFGLMGAPALGVTGAAIGTLVARSVNVAILLVALRWYSLPATRTAGSIPRPVALWKTSRRILAVGFPVAVQNAFAMSAILIFQSLLSTVGAAAQAVTYALFSLFRLNKTITGGFAQGASILVGHALGGGDREGARSITRAQLGIGAVIGVTVAALTLTFPSLIGRQFGLGGADLELMVRGLRFFAPFFFIEILGYSIEIIFTHNGNGRYVLLSEALSNVIGILAIPAVMILVFSSGVIGAWIGFATYQILHAGILGWGYRAGRWLDNEIERPIGETNVHT